MWIVQINLWKEFISIWPIFLISKLSTFLSIHASKGVERIFQRLAMASISRWSGSVVIEMVSSSCDWSMALWWPYMKGETWSSFFRSEGSIKRQQIRRLQLKSVMSSSGNSVIMIWSGYDLSTWVNEVVVPNLGFETQRVPSWGKSQYN